MPRTHPADEQAARNRAAAERQAHALRLTDLALLILLALILLGFGLSIYLLPQESFSEQENRALQTAPAPTFKALADGSFSRDIADFYADQFPAREVFVGLKTLTELASLKYENNGVLIGRDGYLIKRIEYGEEGYANIEANVFAADDLARHLAPAGIPVTLAIAPRGTDVLTDYLPDYYDPARASAAWDAVTRASAALTTTPVTFTQVLRADAAQEVWFRTDHHWTPYGAFCAYTVLGQYLGYTPADPASLTPETVDAPFYGTTYSSAGLAWAVPDTLTFLHLPDEERFTCEIVDTGRTFTGFYDRSYLDGKDKYGALLGGNHGHLRVTDTQAPDKPTLVLIKDSFANAAIPYLARHFNLEVIDLRYFRGSTADLVASASASRVLILMGLDSLATARTLDLLRFGMK